VIRTPGTAPGPSGGGNPAAAPASLDEARGLIETSAVLDVRDAAAFAISHLAGSGQLEAAEFEARRAELPPRAAPVLVVSDTPGAAASAAAALAALGFETVRWLEVPVQSLIGPAGSVAPAARLWRPNPFLAQVLGRLPRGRAADLAAGAGRDAVFLALNGFEVEAWDVDPSALTRALALARRNGVTLTPQTCDLEREPTRIPVARYQVVQCFRFLHRPLFPHIERALAPGGHLVYETYRVGQERFGRPRRPRFLLESGELERAFPSLEILGYDEPSPPGGPWTARLLARRPPG